MQYKIPVQIENEDPILLGLSLRQLSILMGWWGIAYLVFNSLAPTIWAEIALLPSGFIAIITFAIAVFKIHEMTFIPFVLAFVRRQINMNERTWENTTDSFQPMDIGFLTNEKNIKQADIDLDEKTGSLQDLQEKLKNI